MATVLRLFLPKLVCRTTRSVCMRPELAHRSTDADAWLRNASSGFCGITLPGEGDCTGGSEGSWSLSAQASASALAAAQACLARCAACARCRFITTNHRTNDCSWYLNCDLGRLKDFWSDDFKSGVVREQMPPPRSMINATPWQCHSSTPAPRKGVTGYVPGGSGQLGTLRVRSSHCVPSHHLERANSKVSPIATAFDHAGRARPIGLQRRAARWTPRRCGSPSAC